MKYFDINYLRLLNIPELNFLSFLMDGNTHIKEVLKEKEEKYEISHPKHEKKRKN